MMDTVTAGGAVMMSLMMCVMAVVTAVTDDDWCLCTEYGNDWCNGQRATVTVDIVVGSADRRHIPSVR